MDKWTDRLLRILTSAKMIFAIFVCYCFWIGKVKNEWVFSTIMGGLFAAREHSRKTYFSHVANTDVS